MNETKVAATEVEKKAEEKKPYVFPFTVGADPEFTLISGTRPMHAADLFSTFFKGMKKGDHGFVIPGGNIGWDNHDATGELRPNPGSPIEVVNNLKLLFGAAHEKMPFVDMTTLTVSAAAGGHIHLSVPEANNVDIESRGTQRGGKWAAIERAVGAFIVLILMGENSISRQMRKRFQQGQYGDLLDFRVDAKFRHPSGAPGYTLEVRGPTAEWVTTEKIALGTLAYLAIAWDCILGGKLDPIAEILFRNKQQAQEAVNPLMNNLMNSQKTYLNKLRPFIRSHPAYKEYKGVLELIMSPARVIDEKKKAHYCINEGWGFSLESKKIPTNKFLDSDAIEDATAKFPEQVIRNLSQFAWNEDLHVEQFATGLSKRCVALGWKPKHEYFLFGLKKGLSSIIMRDEMGKFIAGTELIKTREDLDVIKKKFRRLGPRAAPVYGRILHPRTGELTNGEDSKRVMIGIPYEMRKKGNLNPLIRLVLKYEKDPKSFSALDEKVLPEGAGELKGALEGEEEMAKGFETALARGEKPRELPQEIQEAAAEEARAEAVDGDLAISQESADAILGKMFSLFQRWEGAGREEVTAAELVQATIGRAAGWPEIQNAETYTEVVRGLSEMLVVYAEEATTNDDVIQTSHAACCYLLLAHTGQSGPVSLEGGDLMHLVRYRNEMFELCTPGRNERSARTPHTDIIMDLLGIRDAHRELVEREILNAADNWIGFVRRENIMPATGIMRDPATARNNIRYFINPDERLPHVWNV